MSIPQNALLSIKMTETGSVQKPRRGSVPDLLHPLEASGLLQFPGFTLGQNPESFSPKLLKPTPNYPLAQRRWSMPFLNLSEVQISSPSGDNKKKTIEEMTDEVLSNPGVTLTKAATGVVIERTMQALEDEMIRQAQGDETIWQALESARVEGLLDHEDGDIFQCMLGATLMVIAEIQKNPEVQSCNDYLAGGALAEEALAGIMRDLCSATEGELGGNPAVRNVLVMTANALRTHDLAFIIPLSQVWNEVERKGALLLASIVCGAINGTDDTRGFVMTSVIASMLLKDPEVEALARRIDEETEFDGIPSLQTMKSFKEKIDARLKSDDEFGRRIGEIQKTFEVATEEDFPCDPFSRSRLIELRNFAMVGFLKFFHEKIWLNGVCGTRWAVLNRLPLIAASANFNFERIMEEWLGLLAEAKVGGLISEASGEFLTRIWERFKTTLSNFGGLVKTNEGRALTGERISSINRAMCCILKNLQKNFEGSAGISEDEEDGSAQFSILTSHKKQFGYIDIVALCATLCEAFGRDSFALGIEQPTDALVYLDPIGIANFLRGISESSGINKDKDVFGITLAMLKLMDVVAMEDQIPDFSKIQTANKAIANFVEYIRELVKQGALTGNFSFGLKNMLGTLGDMATQSPPIVLKNYRKIPDMLADGFKGVGLGNDWNVGKAIETLRSVIEEGFPQVCSLAEPAKPTPAKPKPAKPKPAGRKKGKKSKSAKSTPALKGGPRTTSLAGVQPPPPPPPEPLYVPAPPPPPEPLHVPAAQMLTAAPFSLAFADPSVLLPVPGSEQTLEKQEARRKALARRAIECSNGEVASFSSGAAHTFHSISPEAREAIYDYVSSFDGRINRFGQTSISLSDKIMQISFETSKGIRLDAKIHIKSIKFSPLPESDEPYIPEEPEESESLPESDEPYIPEEPEESESRPGKCIVVTPNFMRDLRSMLGSTGGYVSVTELCSLWNRFLIECGRPGNKHVIKSISRKGSHCVVHTVPGWKVAMWFPHGIDRIRMSAGGVRSAYESMERLCYTL
ncbi:MAG: hypothetical protein LBD33_02175 [Puniceicoccales bacterium]|jgi:hypothetical protein|nr:hypothetical protein [Puniceicoccales bacterium]